MSPAKCASTLALCNGSSRWVANMLGSRPFGERDRLLTAAESAAERLHRDDWIEAFDHHPRIGEQTSVADVATTAASWASSEQSGVATGDAAVQEAILEGNREYEDRFGFIFLIRAKGRTADEILASLRERLGNAPDVEFAIAIREQREITLLRLEQLVPPER